MRRNLLFCFLLVTCLLETKSPSSASAALYQCDQTKSSVIFTLRHLGLLTVSGKFNRFAGSFEFDPDKIENSRVEISIHSGSIHSGNSFRDNDLRSKNFFDSEEYPLILFKSRKIKNVRENQFDIEGDLTIKGVTHTATFHTQLLSIPEESGRLHFYTWAEIHRHDYHLGTSGFNPLLFITNEELRIEMNVQGVPANLNFIAM